MIAGKKNCENPGFAVSELVVGSVEQDKSGEIVGMINKHST